MDTEVIFSERQRFKQIWIWILLLALDAYFIFRLFRQVVINKHPFDKAFLIPTALVLFITLLFFIVHLDTRIKRDGIYVRFFPLHLSFKKYPWNDINKSFVRQYSPLKEFGGWGIRFSMSGKGKAFNISGNKGIQLVFSNNRKLLIGTNKPDEATNALKELGHLKE